MSTRRQHNNKGNIDFVILITTTILLFIGVVMVFSASYYTSITGNSTPFATLIEQVFFVAVGYVVMLIAAKFDYKKIRLLIVPISIVTLVLLFMVIGGFGVSANGATRALVFFSVTVMPGEIAKLTVILLVSALLSTRKDRVNSFTEGILPCIACMALFGGTILIQPNLSTGGIVIMTICFTMFLAGLKWQTISIVSIGAAAVGVGFVLSNPYQLDRIISFLDPFADPLGSGMHVIQSLYALGSGGLFGLGLGDSVQKASYLPFAENDFIFSIIGEELGLIGATIVILLFAFLVNRCFNVAINAKDDFGKYLAGSIGFLIGIHAILHVAVTIGLFPPTGVILPFISSGGNAIVVFMAAIGIVLNVSAQSGGKE